MKFIKICSFILFTVFALTSCAATTTDSISADDSSVMVDTSVAESSVNSLQDELTTEPTSTPVATSTPLPTRDWIFRYGIWGDSPQIIAEYEYEQGYQVICCLTNGDPFYYDGTQTLENIEALIIPYVNINGFDFETVYFFTNDILYTGTYHYAEEHSQAYSYITSYETIKTTFTEKYGTPTRDETVIFDSNMVNYVKDDAKSLEYGYLGYVAEWEFEGTKISLALTSDNYDPSLGIIYQSTTITKDSDFGF